MDITDKNVKDSGRTKKVLANTIGSVCTYFLSYVCSFIYRTVFIRFLDVEYLGLHGVFGNILRLLSLAELGVGSAITFSLYKPLYNDEKEVVSELIGYYKKAYYIIAAIVAGIGALLVPFVHFFVEETNAVSEPLELIYLLYLSDSVCSYFFVYKQSLLNADQKSFIVNIVTAMMHVARCVAQGVVLICTCNYVLTIIVQIVGTVLANLICSLIANKKYKKYIDYPTKKISPLLRTELNKKIFAMLKFNIGAYIVSGTDNLLISKLCSLALVGLYSNYFFITNTLKMFVGYVNKAFTPSVGNYVAQYGKKSLSSLVSSVVFTIFVCSSVLTVCIYNLMNPFIILWIGSDFLLENKVFILICINFYFASMYQSMLVFRNALGLYVYSQWKPIAEAIINIVLSIILGIKFGIFGILLSTTISFLCTGFWVDSYVLFVKYGLTGYKEYWINNIKYALVTIAAILFAKMIGKFVAVDNIFTWVIYAFLCIASTLGIIVLFFHRTEMYIKTKSKVLGMIKVRQRN